ncbi:MAG: hypothetical protein IJC71_01860 [Clostridia bacterium]|nr:hypothetical protein [Clostridia bacterium]
MAVRQRRRTTDATETIRTAVGEIFSCGSFHASKFALPAEKGAQLSMTGDVVAVGNGGSFREDALVRVLSAFPLLWKTGETELRRYALRRRFTILCGDCDRSLAMLGAIYEMVRCGIEKIVIAADTPVERDNIAQSLELMRAGLGNTAITVYRTKAYDASSHYKAYASVYGYLTAGKPEILILSRDSFSRRSNILRRKTSDTAALTDLIRQARPVVITSSETVASGRTLAKNAAIFDPCATMIFAAEERRLRDCVIYRPERTVRKSRELPGMPEQLGF